MTKNGDPYETRTRVARMKTWSPRPLDEGVGNAAGRKKMATPTGLEPVLPG